MEKIDTEALKMFILKASRATYASGDRSIRKKESDESETIQYEEDSYRYHDNYFGGEPYGGREVVFLDDKPIWMMVYYGSIQSEDEGREVYGFLIEALSNSTLEMPYRGPELFQKEGWEYQNKLEGDVEKFSGKEKILKNDKVIYEAIYAGGFVDR